MIPINAEVFREWLRRQGHRVFRTPSSYWYDAGPRVFQAFPYHWIIQPSPHELHKLMVSRGIVSLRYSTPLEASEGIISYHVILRKPYTLEMLRHQARGGVRRGLSHSQVEPISFERLAEEGWLLQRDTLERQGRTSSMSQAEWRKICLAAKGLPGFEAWGAISKGELASALLTTRIDDTCYVPYALSHSKFLRDHVNNALFYSVCRDMLSQDGVEEIFFNLHSLDAPESVDEFKFRMNFNAKPVRQRVVFHPWLQAFSISLIHKATARLLKHYPGEHILAKAEGMLRFHLKGKHPLPEQDWPECLAGRKDELCKEFNAQLLSRESELQKTPAPVEEKLLPSVEVNRK